METDKAFAQLISHNPAWAAELTGMDLPEFAHAAPAEFKNLHIQADMLLTPVDPDAPHVLIELQCYHDLSIYARLQIACQLKWLQLNPRDSCRLKGYRPRPVQGIVIFGSRDFLPDTVSAPAEMTVLFLDKLLAGLHNRHPDSPLYAAMSPLITKRETLEKEARNYYRQILQNQTLQISGRQTLLEVFNHFIHQRFKDKTLKEISAMLAELPPLHETVAGKELLEQGLEQGQKKILQAMASRGLDTGEIARLTDLPEADIRRFLES